MQVSLPQRHLRRATDRRRRLEQAVTAALASFYRHQHAFIAYAIAEAQASHAIAHDARRAELVATERELARTGVAIDRYLTAFENGTLDPEDLAGRLAQLKTKTKQLAVRRDELGSQLASTPAMPPPAALCQVADHVDEIIGAGSHSQRKALVEALIAQVKITGPGRIMPVFRIPQITGSGHVGRSEGSGVRAMTNLVGLTCQHPNPVQLVVEGFEIAVRPVRSRHPAGVRSPTCG